MKMKKGYVVLFSFLALVIVAGCIFAIKYRFTVTELPQESLVINERGWLMEIKDKPSGRYSVTLPSNVTHIIEGIFENDSMLVSITFNDDLKEIGKNAFKGCTALESVVLTGNIEKVGEYAFSGCTSLKKLEFAYNTCNVMERYVFSDCTRLESVRFAESETGVAAGMFANCLALREVYLSDNVQTIGAKAFGDCVSLKNIALPDSLRHISIVAFKGCRSLADISIPDAVQSIYSDSFEGCKLLMEKEDGITYVDGFAVGVPEDVEILRFREGTRGVAYALKCPNVQKVYIPSSVTCISDTFRETETLTEVIIADNSRMTSLPAYAFYKCTALERIDFGKNSSLTTLGWASLCDCDSLESIVFPASLESLTIALYDCDKLEKVEFEEGSRLRIIGDGALKNNPLLKEFGIPDGVLEVGGWSFKDCVSLEKVVIPSSVTVIGEMLLQGCDSIAEVEMASPDGWCYYGDYGKTKQEEIPAECLSDPQAAAEWFKAYLEVKRSMKKDN